MNIILLSGGKGKRLWPLSNNSKPKQFLKLLKKEDGTYESMLQRTYRKIKGKDESANILVTAAQDQIDEIYDQLGYDVNVSIEPSIRDTFSAIVLATAYLKEKMHVLASESVLVCPVDTLSGDDYYNFLPILDEIINKEEENLTLVGIEPYYPSEKYGYILPASTNFISKVIEFVEKPNIENAKKFIKQGALWNSGIFAYKINYILKKAQEIIGYSSYTHLYKTYQEIKRISFDYAIVELEKSIQVVRFPGKWKDLGTWGTLIEELPYNTIGNTLCENCNNTHIINIGHKPIVCIGVDNLIVAASSEGFLIVSKDKADDIKSIIERIE